MLVACVLPLTRKLQLDMCAKELGVPRARLRLCKHSQLVSVCGYPHGAIGPVGLRHCPAAVLLDHSLAGATSILCGGGEPQLVFAVPPHALVGALRHARWGAVAEPGAAAAVDSVGRAAGGGGDEKQEQ